MAAAFRITVYLSQELKPRQNGDTVRKTLAVLPGSWYMIVLSPLFIRQTY